MKIYIRSNDYEDLEVADQQFSSKSTAINAKQNKLPTIFKLVSFPRNSLVLDYGGEMQAEMIANDYLAQFGCEDVVYDKYNQTSAEQSAAIKRIRDNGGADVAVCSNVLNVIAEDEARLVVLRNIKKLTKAGAPVYFTVHEGDGKGGSRPTGKDQFQQYRKTDTYLDEIRQVFPDATRKGKLISATNR